jgi:hypothetical protein
MRGPSRIQPDTDPFSIPTTSLYDRLAPAAQFLTLFALFTAAGTAFLMSGGFAKQSHEATQSPIPRATPPTATVRQILEPVSDEIEQSTTAPSASGPLGSKAAAKVEDVFAGIDDLPAADADKSSTTSTAAQAAGDPLPRVQTTEPQAAEIAAKPAETDDPVPPPAIARLPGIILDASPRQAQHDQQQPGLH